MMRVRVNAVEKTTAPTVLDCPCHPLVGGGPNPWAPPAALRMGGSRLTTWHMLKADVTKGWKYQVTQIDGSSWVNQMGSYGMAIEADRCNPAQTRTFPFC